MQNKRLLTIVLATLVLTLPSLLVVNAGVGSIRIEPAMPLMSDSSADFTIWVQGVDDADDPHILLVMTESCYDGLGGSGVVVHYGLNSVTISKGEFTEENNGGKIPEDTTNGAQYTVASLKDHLDTDDPIYWAFVSIPGLDEMEAGTKYDIQVELDSSSPKMLVYILGKDSEMFDMRVPPTLPGFMMPEVPIGTVLSLVTMAAAAGLMQLRKK